MQCDIIDLLVGSPLLFSQLLLVSLHVDTRCRVLLTGCCGSLTGTVALLLLIIGLLLMDPLLDEGLEPLTRNMLQSNTSLLIREKPGEDIFIRVQSALLVRHIVAGARLLVQLGQTISSLFEAIFQSDQMHFCSDLRWLVLLMHLLLMMVGLIVCHGVQVAVWIGIHLTIVSFHDGLWVSRQVYA